MNISKMKVRASPAAATPRPVELTAQDPVAGHNQPKGPVSIDRTSFPDQPPRGESLPCTIANVRYMLAENGVLVRYNVIKKRTEIDIPWLTDSENPDGVAMTYVLSLASLYTLPTGLVPALTDAVADENAYNPAKDWITSKPWDGIDRLPAICNTITPRENFRLALRDVLITKWLLSATAAALLPKGFRSRGVLTLQGPQSMGKTSWGLSLIDDKDLRAKLVKVDHHLDAGNKDSQLGAIDHWFVEIGELESSFRRDVSRLKGFLTSGSDKIRRPYARVSVEYQRRTVFYATVNADDFLVDPTGNARWWTIPCTHINYSHDVDMQQVFAQLAVKLAAGEIWWLTASEEKALEAHNSAHRSVSVVTDRLEAIIDRSKTDRQNCPAMTASEVLLLAGFDRPTNGQAKECSALLREWFGDSSRSNGRNKWRIPLRRNVDPTGLTEDDET